MSKLAEEFVVELFVQPAILSVLDKKQFGAIPGSSTTNALISMIDCWSKATDGNGATVRVVLFDFKKSFDLIDHNLLMSKLRQLELDSRVINWLKDFLTNRYQRTKLAKDCYSEWGRVPCGVPQGTKLGPWLFLLMINDLAVPNANLWKYVDDTTESEIIPKGAVSNMQESVDLTNNWSTSNNLCLNLDKCKELQISFSKQSSHFQPLSIGEHRLELITECKLLGVTISDDLKWNKHIDNIVSRASKRIYFLVQLKRAKVEVNNLVKFYKTCIRSLLEYCCAVFHDSLPDYLHLRLERVQIRCMSIIYPATTYENALEIASLSSLKQRREKLVAKLFTSSIKDQDHQLNCLLPNKKRSCYNFRKKNTFTLPKCRTDRYKNTFIPANIFKLSN